jgi:hypothetical protein
MGQGVILSHTQHGPCDANCSLTGPLLYTAHSVQILCVIGRVWTEAALLAVAPPHDLHSPSYISAPMLPGPLVP